MANKLADERTDGSAPALYLLVERMRPVLRALAEQATEDVEYLESIIRRGP